MNKSKLMVELKNKKGGTYIKENGRWNWVNGSEKVLVTTGWLLNKINEPETVKTSEVVQIKEEQKTEPVAVIEEAKAVTVKKPTPKKKKETESQ